MGEDIPDLYYGSEIRGQHIFNMYITDTQPSNPPSNHYSKMTMFIQVVDCSFVVKQKFTSPQLARCNLLEYFYQQWGEGLK